MTLTKRILSLLLAVLIVMTLAAGCTESTKENQPPPFTSAPEEEETEPTESTTAATEPATEATEPATEAATEPATEATEPTTEATTTEVTTTESTTEATTAATEAVTTSAAPEIVVTPMDAVMYAIADVSVRTGPATTYERVGHVSEGNSVIVTGQADTGWYRIKFKDGEYFVSNSYLSTEKVTVATTATTVTEAAPVTEATTAAAPEPENKQQNDIWIATWSTAVMPPDGPDKIPSNPKLDNNTVRQQIRVSAGGNKLRLVLSNEHGESELKIEDLRLAKLKSPSSYYTVDNTEIQLTYNGATSFSIPAGQRITTDVMDYEFEALDDLAISMKLGAVPKTLTCHTASRCTTWVVKGNHVADNGYAKDRQNMSSWYFIAELDTMAAKNKGTIVCFGDSLTDGASIRENSFSRYSDQLAKRLSENNDLNGYGVAAMGIGATALYSYGGQIAGTNRANRDILKVPNVKYVILMMGINDIGGAQNDISQNIIKEYKSIIERCHKKDIKVIGMTLTPNKGSGYYSELREKIRLSVNKFIMSDDSGFDGFIDASSVVASKNDPAKMDQKYLSGWGDWLHFNETGYKAIGDAVYEYLEDFIND